MTGIGRGPIKIGGVVEAAALMRHAISHRFTAAHGGHNLVHEDHDTRRQFSAGDPEHMLELDPILADPRPEPR